MLRSLWLWLKIRLFVSGHVSLGSRFHLGLLSYLGSSGGLQIGNDVYVGKFCTIQCNGRIGDNVLIANNVGIVGAHDHDMRQIGMPIRRARWVGDTPELSADPRNAVAIGEDVWIGFGATVLSGITIGRGAIVAAGSVVREDVAPYDVVAGNPAKPVARRFTDAQVNEHETLISRRLS